MADPSVLPAYERVKAFVKSQLSLGVWRPGDGVPSEAALPSRPEARGLGIKPSTPCLVMVRCTVSGPHVASLARLIYPGLRYSLRGQFQL